MEEPRLRIFGGKFPRRLYGSMQKEVTREWRKLKSKDLHNLYSFTDTVIIPRRLRWMGHETLKREIRNAYNILFGKLEGKRPNWRHA
jgi:hypothetical protein